MRFVGPQRDLYCLSVISGLHIATMMTGYSILGFGNVSTPFNTLVIWRHPGKILRRSSQGNPSVGGVKHKRGSHI